MEEDLFALFEDLKNSGPRGNNRVKQVSKTRMVGVVCGATSKVLSAPAFTSASDSKCSRYQIS